MGHGSIRMRKEKVPPSKEMIKYIRDLVDTHSKRQGAHRQNFSLPFDQAFEDLDSIHRLYTNNSRSKNPTITLAKEKLAAKIEQK